MNRNPGTAERRYPRTLAMGVAVLISMLRPCSLFACAACYGQSDSAMAKGMNLGILSLLVVVVTVLGSIAGFFVFLARRSANTVASEVLSDPQIPITTH